VGLEQYQTDWQDSLVSLPQRLRLGHLCKLSALNISQFILEILYRLLGTNKGLISIIYSFAILAGIAFLRFYSKFPL
jgi:hypothetical protein